MDLRVTYIRFQNFWRQSWRLIRLKINDIVEVTIWYSCYLPVCLCCSRVRPKNRRLILVKTLWILLQRWIRNQSSSSLKRCVFLEFVSLDTAVFNSSTKAMSVASNWRCFKLVQLVAVTNHTKAAVRSTNHMSGLFWLTSHFPLLLYRCMLPRLQTSLKAISWMKGGKQLRWGLMV